MRRSGVLVLVLLVPLWAGCFSEDRGDDQEPEAPAAPTPPATIPSLWWFTENMTLEPTAPAIDGPGPRVRLGWSWAEYYAGTPPPFWEGPVTQEPYRVTLARADIHFVGRQETVDPGLRPALTAWFGAADSVVAHGFFEGPQMIGRDQVVNASFEFQLPAGGLVVEPGEALRVHVGDYYLDADLMTAGGRVQVLVGTSLAPTHLYIEAEPVDLPAVTEATIVDEAGTLRGDGCGTSPAPLDAEASQSFPFVVPDDAAGVRIGLTTQHVAGGHDVDLDIMGPGDALLATGWSPGGQETIDLFLHNIEAAGAGDWSVRVYTCQPQVVEYVVTVVVLTPTQATAAGEATPA